MNWFKHMLTRLKSKQLVKKQFQELTGVTSQSAQRFVENANYNLEIALDNYYSRSSSPAVTTTTSDGPRKYDKRLVSLFSKYKEDEKHIGIDGTISYLEDLSISPEDPLALTIAYFLKAPRVGVFTRDSFITIWQHYSCFSIVQMKSVIGLVHKDILSPSEDKKYTDVFDGKPLTLKGMYEFTFEFLKEVENQRVLDVDTCIDYWKLFMPMILQSTKAKVAKQVEVRLDQWYKFLHEDYKKPISFDGWCQFYLFVQDIIINDPEGFTNYDEMQSWPSVMDEYIEYLRDNELLESNGV
ncbi:Defective in cullin neddylation protein 1 [Spathaspora sp. JA1]|nr:Defective in cullin neddylation protein 1 [Spathaspora sp. JA1]